jgi:hypothetical protein
MSLDISSSKLKAIRKAIDILKDDTNKNKMMYVEEMNYVIDTLKGMENQLKLGQDEQPGTA